MTLDTWWKTSCVLAWPVDSCHTRSPSTMTRSGSGISAAAASSEALVRISGESHLVKFRARVRVRVRIRGREQIRARVRARASQDLGRVTPDLAVGARRLRKCARLAFAHKVVLPSRVVLRRLAEARVAAEARRAGPHARRVVWVRVPVADDDQLERSWRCWWRWRRWWRGWRERIDHSRSRVLSPARVLPAVRPPARLLGGEWRRLEA